MCDRPVRGLSTRATRGAVQPNDRTGSRAIAGGGLAHWRARARACVCACVCARARVCARLRVYGCVCVYVCTCALPQWLWQGDKQWGKDMQNDITDTVRWAIAQDWADPAKICA